MLWIELLDLFICSYQSIRTIYCSFLEKVKSCPKIVHILFLHNQQLPVEEKVFFQKILKKFFGLMTDCVPFTTLTSSNKLIVDTSNFKTKKFTLVFFFWDLHFLCSSFLAWIQLEVLLTTTVFFAVFLFVCLPFCFLAAQSSSKSLVVGWSLARSLAHSLGLLVWGVCERVTLRVSNGN